MSPAAFVEVSAFAEAHGFGELLLEHVPEESFEPFAVWTTFRVTDAFDAVTFDRNDLIGCAPTADEALAEALETLQAWRDEEP